MTNAPPPHGVSLVDKLRHQLTTTLEQLNLRGRRVALLDFPHYPNVGDSAIWLGEQVAFRRLGARVVYACHSRSYSRRRLARRIKDGVICLSGGGNFGDLYHAHQELRERVLADFPDHEIVQLPQTISFADRSRIPAVGDVVRRHRRFTLLLRDRPSVELAERHWGVKPVLCTDMAFALGSLARPRRSDVDVLALRQSVYESTGVLDCLRKCSMPVVDWGERDDPSRLQYLVRRSERVGQDHPRLFGWAAHAAGAVSFNTMALARLERGRRVIERGRVVITDRLHGHILCLLADIPHVLLDNRYGKVLSFHDAWTSGSPLVRKADTAEMAVRFARQLAEEAHDTARSRE